MSTCFLPVAAELRSGDEVLGIGTHAFVSARTVVARRCDGQNVVVSFVDGSEVCVDADTDVALLPPF